MTNAKHGKFKLSEEMEAVLRQRAHDVVANWIGAKTKAQPSGIKLDERDAAIVKGMLAGGDPQHDNLPPAGPYPSGRASNEARKIIETAVDELLEMAARLEQQLKEI